jgi:hypothetical protein
MANTAIYYKYQNIKAKCIIKIRGVKQRRRALIISPYSRGKSEK